VSVGGRIKNFLMRRSPVPLDAAETRRQNELRQTVAGLPSLDGPPPASAAAAEWLGNRRRLRQLLNTSDPRRFLEWDVIRKTMFAEQPRAWEQVSELKRSAEWGSRWKAALREDRVGCPRRLRWRLASSGNLVNHATHVHYAEPLLGRRLDSFRNIIEFGGGYGSWCRLAWRLGFRGRYVIFDLPEFSALQRYFLQSVGIPIATNGATAGVRLISELSDLHTEAAGADGDCLFVGLWSISETSLGFRRQVLAELERVNYFLIGYQERFEDVDNLSFFKEWSTARRGIEWNEIGIARHPGNRYLIGRAVKQA
jgi:hypothetical protein